MKEMAEYQIGNTSLAELPEIRGNRILLKLEAENFLGSVKARTAYGLIRDLPEAAKGKTLVESTSGNLGFALGWFCREQGLDFVALVDASTPQVKLDRMTQEGITYEIVPQEGNLDLRTSRMRQAQRMMESGEYYWLNQYDNPAGVRIHEETTGPELWTQTAGKITHCVCAMGSCGTICGIARFLKKTDPKVEIWGVEPLGSTIYGQEDLPYLNAGAGAFGMPGNLRRNAQLVDGHYTITDAEAIAAAQELHHRFGLDVGITGGMNYAAAQKLAQQVTDAVIVAIAADGRGAYPEQLD